MDLSYNQLRAASLIGHFGTGAEMSWHFAPTWTVPKCLSADLSRVQSVRLP